MAHADPNRQHYGLTLAVLVLGALAFALSQTMIAPALPDIQAELGASQTTATFAFTAFLLTASVATPILGRLGDMFGKERVLMLTFLAFGAGSLICAISDSVAGLIAGRALAGVAGAVFPLSFGIIRDEFPRERVAAGIGLLSATFGIGGGAGFVFSGLLVDHVGYHSIFWLSVVMTAAVVVLTHFFVPESPVKTPAKIDWAGGALLAVGLSSVLIGVSEGNSWGWESARIVSLFALGIAGLAAWVVYEHRVAEPLVDMKMMRQGVVATTNLTAFLVGFGMFGVFLLIPQLVQLPEASGVGFGATTTEAGLYMIPSALAMLFVGPLSGWIGGRVGSKIPLVLGTAIFSSSFLFLALEHSTPASIYIGSAFFGIGMGFAWAAMANLIVSSVDQTQTGVATGINTIMRTIGGALGGQVTASVIAASVAATGLPTDAGFTDAFLISAAGSFVALLAAISIPLKRERRAGFEPVEGPVEASGA